MNIINYTNHKEVSSMVIALKNDDLYDVNIWGELCSIQCKEGIEYLWQDSDYWSGQAPFCSICGSVRNGQVQYHLKMEEDEASFQDTVSFAAERAELKEQQTIVLFLKSPSTTRSKISLPFSSGNRLWIERERDHYHHCVQNLESDQVMPYISLEGIHVVPFSRWRLWRLRVDF